MDACGRYYFPEIPCAMQTDQAAAPRQKQFVSCALDQDIEAESSPSSAADSKQTRQLIEEAFSKGKDQGCAETIAEHQETINQAADALKAAVEELIRIRRQDIDRMESATVQLALAIAKKIIGNEAERGTVIESVVKTAMKKVADPRNLTLRVNPADIDTVNGFQQDLCLADDFKTVLRLEADETIKRGGCIIETQLGDVDARIDQQIKVVEESLTAQLPQIPIEG